MPVIGHRGHASGAVSCLGPASGLYTSGIQKFVCARRFRLSSNVSVSRPCARMRFFTSSSERALSCEEAADPTPVELAGRVLEPPAPAPLWLLREPSPSPIPPINFFRIASAWRACFPFSSSAARAAFLASCASYSSLSARSCTFARASNAG